MRVHGVAVLGLLLAVPSTVSATLIGDDIFVEYHFPDLGTSVESHAVVVQAGNADEVTFFTAAPQLSVDVEASSIFINFFAATFFLPGNFNGVVVRDLDWVDGPGEIVGLNITTNLPGWNDAFASFTADSVAVNWASFGQHDPFTMTIDLETRHAPEPATLALLAIGLGALCWRRSS